MKILKVEDWRKSGSGFKVIESTDTIEWEMGDFITETDMARILSRHGTNTVKVNIKPKS